MLNSQVTCHYISAYYAQGWVPKGELSSEVIDYPEKVFYLGQVVTCRVISCNSEQEKLLLSLKVLL